MAEYRIILNIGGSAVRQAERLADALQRADKHAKSLSQDLRSVPKVNVSGSYASGRVPSPSMLRLGGGVELSAAGTMGHIAGMVMGTFAKIMSQATKLSYSGGFMVTNRLKDVLMGEHMSEAIRYIQRRKQLRVSLGDDADAAIRYSDVLANSYGLNRATTLGSFNVLTGLRMGGTGQAIDTKTAASIIKVGGLIAQQGGYSYERVMTNFQQLFANSIPSKRDIREMLGQAPVFARYATEMIAKMGMTGKMDMYDYYKSHENIARSMRRYDIENPISNAAYARGRIMTAEQDVYNKLAENNAWGMVATNYVGVLKAFGEAMNDIVSALGTNSAVRNSINGLISLIETLGKNSGWIVNLVTTLSDYLAKTFGIQLEGMSREEITQKQNAVLKLFDLNKGYLRERWYAENKNILSTDPKDAKRNEEYFETWFQRTRDAQVAVGSPLYRAVKASEQYRITTDVSSFGITTRDPNDVMRSPEDPQIFFGMGYEFSRGMQNRLTDLDNRIKRAELSGQAIVAPIGAPVLNEKSRFSQPQDLQYVFISREDLAAWANTEFSNAFRINNDFTNNSKPTEDDGSSIKDFNKDRRSLEIHFHAPIVEWNSEINTDDPKEVVDAVANNIEGAASRAIQIALLGASQKMSTRWY